MSTTTVPASGPVAFCGRELVVESLATAQEIGLLRAMRRLAKKQFGPGGFVQRGRPMLDWMRANGMAGEASAALAELVRMEGAGADPDDDVAEAARQTPEGVATELFWRTRRTHPDATLAELMSVVTDANALDVHLQILAAVRPDPKATTPSA